jgi:hypothetical protein
MPRPRRAKGLSVTRTIRVTATEWRAFATRARRMGMTRSDWVRRACALAMDPSNHILASTAVIEAARAVVHASPITLSRALVSLRSALATYDQANAAKGEIAEPPEPHHTRAAMKRGAARLEALDATTPEEFEAQFDLDPEAARRAWAERPQ